MFNDVFLIELVSQPPQMRECVVVVISVVVVVVVISVVVIVVYFFVCVLGLFIFK